MKKLLMALALVMCAGVAKADGMLDFSSFFTHARAGYSVNQHMVKSTVIYSAVQRLHTVAGLELASVNAGYDMTSKHPILATGIRADNLIPLIWGGEWGKAHITTASLPAIEFGPYLSGWPRNDGGKVKVDFWYGIVAAVGFSK